MAAPVNAPAAAPAAAPIDAARTFPVAAPPIIAPVAAPHAAPWPTGVSQEFSVRQIKAMADATERIFVPIMRYFTPLNRAAREMLRERSQESLYPAERMLGVYSRAEYKHANY